MISKRKPEKLNKLVLSRRGVLVILVPGAGSPSLGPRVRVPRTGSPGPAPGVPGPDGPRS